MTLEEKVQRRMLWIAPLADGANVPITLEDR
jgi:hypothetical protein